MQNRLSQELLEIVFRLVLAFFVFAGLIWFVLAQFIQFHIHEGVFALLPFVFQNFRDRIVDVIVELEK